MASHGRGRHYGARQTLQGTFLRALVRSPPSTVGAEGTLQHVRHPRFPQNPPTQLGPRAEKISGRYCHHPLHPKWSRSRVSLGDSTKPSIGLASTRNIV